MVLKKKSAEAYVKITFSLKCSTFIFKENFSTDVIYMWYMSYIIYILILIIQNQDEIIYIYEIKINIY